MTGGLPNAGLAGNWYHFRNNGFNLWNATGGANDARKFIRDNAVDCAGNGVCYGGVCQ